MACKFSSGTTLLSGLTRSSYSKGIPLWKSLVDSSLTLNEQTILITDIFSDRDETEAVKSLRGEDAQSFIDLVDKVLHFSLLEDRLSDSNLDFVITLSRCWIASARRSDRSV